MSDRVLIDVVDGVADVRLNRPDKMNALDDEMFTALIETGKQLSRQSNVRAVVLSGEGRSFCAGLDFSNFSAMAGDGQSGGGTTSLLSRNDESIANRAQRAAWVWQEVPVPVIAAVHGVAFGGGLQIALGADIRYVTPDARLSVLEIKWGLVPDMSGTQTLRRLLPLDLIKELTWTGREVSGREAVEIGLATHVSEDPRSDALSLARTIASKSPSAIRAGKALLNSAVDGSIEQGLLVEEKRQLSVIGKPNQIEAVRSNLEKRDAVYDDAEAAKLGAAS